jgi:regulatory protein
MSSASDALAAALRLLTGRERSSAELGARLQQKGFPEELVAATLERCRELNYLDDRRFALERARALLRSGRAVGPRVLADLQARGIDREAAREALEQALDGADETELLQALLRRRFPEFQPAVASDRERRRVIDYCLRRGFSSALVFSLIRHER